MKDIKLLLAVLTVYRSNLDILHWKASGTDFDTYHHISERHSKNMSNDIDTVAEMLLMYNENPLNYEEALDILKTNDTVLVKILKSDDDYTSTQIIYIIDEMFGNIIKLLVQIIENSDDIIKTEFENLLFYYSKEKMYINKRRRD